MTQHEPKSDVGYLFQIETIKTSLTKRLSEGFDWTLARFRSASFAFFEREIDAHVHGGDLAFAAGISGALRFARPYLRQSEDEPPTWDAVEHGDGLVSFHPLKR